MNECRLSLEAGPDKHLSMTESVHVRRGLNATPARTANQRRHGSSPANTAGAENQAKEEVAPRRPVDTGSRDEKISGGNNSAVAVYTAAAACVNANITGIGNRGELPQPPCLCSVTPIN